MIDWNNAGSRATAAPIITLGDKQAAALLEAYASFIERNTKRMASLQPGPEAETMAFAAEADAKLARSLAANLRRVGGVDDLIAELAEGGVIETALIEGHTLNRGG